MTAYETVRLSSIPVEKCRCINQFLECLGNAQLPQSLVIEDHLYQLNLSLVAELPRDLTAVRIHLDNRETVGFIAKNQLIRWLSILLNTNMTYGTPTPLLLVLLEKSLQSLQPYIHQYLGSEIIFEESESAETSVLNQYFLKIDLSVRNREQQIATLTVFSSCEQHPEWVLQQLRKLPLATTSEQLALPVNIQLLSGYTVLSQSEFSQLATGDIVLFDHCLLLNNTVQLNVAQTPLATANIAGPNLTVQTLHGVLMEEDTMPTQPNEEVTDNLSSLIDTLPICIHFEVGSMTLPLEQLKKITPGQVFELSGLLESPIHLTVNGKKIGQGELVKLGDRPGVRLLTLNNTQDFQPSPNAHSIIDASQLSGEKE